MGYGYLDKLANGKSVLDAQTALETAGVFRLKFKSLDNLELWHLEEPRQSKAVSDISAHDAWHPLKCDQIRPWAHAHRYLGNPDTSGQVPGPAHYQNRCKH